MSMEVPTGGQSAVLKVRNTLADFDDRLLPPTPTIFVSESTLQSLKASYVSSNIVNGGFVCVKSAIATSFARLLVRNSGAALGPEECTISSILCVSLFHKLCCSEEPLEISPLRASKPLQAKDVTLSLAPFPYSTCDQTRTPSPHTPTLDANFLSKYVLPSTIITRGSFFVVNWFNRLDLVYVVRCASDRPENVTETPPPLNSNAKDEEPSLLYMRETTRVSFVSWQDTFLSETPPLDISPKAPQLISSSILKETLKKDVGGLDTIVDDLVDISSLSISGKYSNMPRGFVFVGASGSGKTHLARLFAERCGLKPVMVNAPELFQSGESATEEALSHVFRTALDSPSVLVIDEIESIASDRKTTDGAIERRLLAHFTSLLDDLWRRAPSSLCIGICGSLSALDPSILRPKRLERVFYFPIPSPEARLQILSIQTRKLPFASDSDLLHRLAQRTAGFTGSDLSNLCRHTLLAHIKQYGGIESDLPPIPYENFEASLRIIRPSALSAYATSHPLVSFDELRGIDEVVESLKASLLAPFAEEARYRALGAKPPSGVLLYGPPGVGKSKLAMAVATASKVNFLTVNATEIVSKVVGESESNLSQIFKTARAASPCILFLDQIESIARARGSDTTEEQSSDRMLSLLLTEMDGIQKASDAHPSLSASNYQEEPIVIVLAATNKPHLLDSAVLRPGRFDNVIFVPPTTPETRLDIIRFFATRTPCVDVTDEQWTELAKRTKGFSGADLESLFREASYLALKKDISSDRVSWDIILEVLPEINPSLLRTPITHPYNRKVGFTFVS